MNKVTNTFLVVGLLLFTRQSSAQFNPVWVAQYEHSASPGFSNEGRKVVEDAAGNVFMLADVTSDIDPSGVSGSTTFHYVTITKYSTNGSLLNSVDIDIQDHHVSGYDNISAFGLIVDAIGDVYVGYTSWNASSGFDIALAKYDNSLVNQWTNSYPLSGSETGIDFKLDAAGTVYAVVKSVDLQTVYSIIKSVPSNGSSQLVYEYPGNGVVINSLALDNSQNAYVAGYAVKGGNKNAYIASIDLLSNSVYWSGMYSPKGIVGDDVLNEITVGADGNIYSVGVSDQGAGGKRILVLKNIPFNSKFDFIVLLRGSTPNTSGRFIDASESGWVYVGATSIGDNHAYIYRIPDDGVFNFAGRVEFTPEPVASYNAITSISLGAMKVTSSKNVYITGSIVADGPSGTFSAGYFCKASVVFGNALVSAGEMPVDGDFNNNVEGVDISLDYSKSDVYLIRNNWDDIHSKETIEVIDLNVPSPLRKTPDFSSNESTLSIVQNFENGSVLVKSREPITSIEVFELTGKTALFESVGLNQKTIKISGLAPGIYLCRARTDSEEATKKLIIN